MATGITSRTISVILNRLKGIPRSAASWQASAFICAISSGEKRMDGQLWAYPQAPVLAHRKKRLRHLLTVFPGRLSLLATSLFSMPSVAMKITCALITSL